MAVHSGCLLCRKDSNRRGLLTPTKSSSSNVIKLDFNFGREGTRNECTCMGKKDFKYSLAYIVSLFRVI